MALTKLGLLLAAVLAAASLRVSEARGGITSSNHRRAANPFAESSCVVRKWPACITHCPTNSTLPAVMMGRNGANVGKFVPASMMEYPDMSIESCCKACGAFNDLHWNNIFGYVCDYWSWQQVNGFRGHCSLFDQKTVCGPLPAQAKSLFNTSRTDTVAFPALCT